MDQNFEIALHSRLNGESRQKNPMFTSDIGVWPNVIGNIYVIHAG